MVREQGRERAVVGERVNQADEGGGFERGVEEKGGRVGGADGGLETLHRPARWRRVAAGDGGARRVAKTTAARIGLGIAACTGCRTRPAQCEPILRSFIACKMACLVRTQARRPNNRIGLA